MSIQDFVPVGHENAIERVALSRAVGLDDRECRDLIAKYNKSGEGLIINMQDGKGYFRPSKDEDDLVRHWLRIRTSRAIEENTIVRNGLKYLRQDENQMELF